MKAGDAVRVYPHGSPEKKALAKVAIISENQCGIAVMFLDKPPFVTMGGRLAMAIDPEKGGLVVMFATRAKLNGEPWGPWVEMSGGGHYEIEPLRDEEYVEL